MLHNRWIITSTVILILIVACLGTATTMVLADNDYAVQVYYPGDLMNKMHSVEFDGGGEMILHENAVNELLAVFLDRFKKGISVPDLTVNGLNAQVSGSRVTLYLPITFKGIGVLLSSQGSVTMNQDQVLFDPFWFRAGRLTVPKRLAFGLLNRYSKGDTKVSQNRILLPKTFLPFTLSTLAVQDDRMRIYIEPLAVVPIFRSTTKLQGETATKPASSNAPYITGSEQRPQPQVAAVTPVIANTTPQTNPGSPVQTPAISQQPATPHESEPSIPNPPSPSPDQTKQALTQLLAQLNTVGAQLTTGEQKQVISLIQASMNKTIVDASYNFVPDAEYVRKLYYTLSSEDRTAIKLSLLSNVDPQLVLELRNTFGI